MAEPKEFVGRLIAKLQNQKKEWEGYLALNETQDLGSEKERIIADRKAYIQHLQDEIDFHELVLALSRPAVVPSLTTEDKKSVLKDKISTVKKSEY